MTSLSHTGNGEGLVLVADVGGTNTRIALANKLTVLADSTRRYRNKDFGNLNIAINHFLEELSQPAPCGACIAVAGPVINNQVQLTNISWEVDGLQLSRSLGGIHVEVINDLQAIGYALHLLQSHEMQTIINAPSLSVESCRLVINVGTGFNAVSVHKINNRYFAAPSEFGHTALPVINDEFYLLHNYIEELFGFASVEDVLSGRGSRLLKGWIKERSAANKTDISIQKLETDYHRILVSLLGSTARNLALTHLPFDGIYLTGGLIRAIVSHLTDGGFIQEFHSAGRFSEFMEQFPVHVIQDDLAALRGCAAGFSYMHETI